MGDDSGGEDSLEDEEKEKGAPATGRCQAAEEGSDRDGGGSDDDEEDEDEMPDTQRSSVVRTQLRLSSRALALAAADPLAGVIADTDGPVATTVLAKRKKGKAAAKEKAIPAEKSPAKGPAKKSPGVAGSQSKKARGAPGKPGSFVGKRDTSISVAFDDSFDTLEEFEECPALPKHSMAPLPSFVAPLAAGKARSKHSTAATADPSGAPVVNKVRPPSRTK